MKNSVTKIVLLSMMSVSILFFSCSDSEDLELTSEPVVKEKVQEKEEEAEVSNVAETVEEDIEVKTKSEDVIIDDTVEYTASLDGKDITESAKWTSSDEKILKSEGKGKFTALEAGSVTITVSYKESSKKVQLQIHLRPELIEGDKYSELLFGIENCIKKGKSHDYTVGDVTWGWYGDDGDDAYFDISGEDLTLTVYKDKLYLIANKDQDIEFRSFTYLSSSWGNKTHINTNSKLTVKIKDRDDKVLNTIDNVQICPEHGNYYVLTATSMKDVKKGSSIDITGSFEGTTVGEGKNCEYSTSKFSEKSGYKLMRDNKSDKRHAKYNGDSSDYQTKKLSN